MTSHRADIEDTLAKHGHLFMFAKQAVDATVAAWQEAEYGKGHDRDAKAKVMFEDTGITWTFEDYKIRYSSFGLDIKESAVKLCRQLWDDIESSRGHNEPV